MKHKLGICIPYRNRKEHLEQLIPSLSKHLEKQGIEFGFYVGHQVDEKLFNRGAMKNIAAEFAFRDGCDYVAFHDVDMLPINDSCDYSYPEEFPIHISTKLSKYNYGLGYDQYFGGVVLFNKEHIEKTNGYSNDYWDWGQEDDDLFWRCYFEGYTTGKIFKKYENKPYAKFNGESSVMILPINRKISSCLDKDHTVSILFKADQKENVPIWLVGDKHKEFVEYPLLRKNGCWSYGMSFNNSRAVTMTLYDEKNTFWYNYGKRFEGMWTWATMSYSEKESSVYFYINNELVRNMNGVVESLPFPIGRELKKQNFTDPFLLGFCNYTKTHYKGLISEVKILNKFYPPEEVGKVFNDKNLDTVLHYDFKGDDVADKISGLIAEGMDVDFDNEDIEVVENVLPYRKDGEFFCLPHQDEGYVNGTWFKGETTARNERRLVTQMQQRKINYKSDGMNSLKYELVNTEQNNKCLMINVKL